MALIPRQKAQASYRNGVLELHMPRPEGAHGKRIAVQGQQAGAARPAATQQAGNGGAQPQAAQQGAKAVR
jgi:hypothetical protein